jgi:NTE family protein
MRMAGRNDPGMEGTRGKTSTGMTRPRRALVLGAGGYAAMSWEVGVLSGMAEAGTDPREADLFVGTSAGAIVAAQITSGVPLDELFRRQLASRGETEPSAPVVDFRRWRDDLGRARSGGGPPTEVLRRIGSLALAVPPGTPSDRPEVASLLPRHVWPEQQLLTVAVDVRTGERRVFDRASGIDFVDAVAASGVVAGISQPVTFNGHGYMDGGFYSLTNADLALGCDRVLVISLPARVPPLSVVSLEAELEQLRASHARVEVVHPDEPTQAAFASVGGNLLDPSVCEPGVRAGREQGRRITNEGVSSFWQ